MLVLVASCFNAAAVVQCLNVSLVLDTSLGTTKYQFILPKAKNILKSMGIDLFCEISSGKLRFTHFL